MVTVKLYCGIGGIGGSLLHPDKTNNDNKSNLFTIINLAKTLVITSKSNL